MQIYTGEKPRIPHNPRGIALGFFDGLHRGHADLLRTLLHVCSERDISAAALTFSEHPGRVVHKDLPFPGYLMTLDERVEKMASLGLDELYIHPFDEAFASMDANVFLDTILLDQLQAQVIVVGPDYRFGFHGAGDVAQLKTWAQTRQVDVIIVSEVMMEGAKVSSSRIRTLIQKGAVREAAALMGSSFQITGTVTSGRGLGRGMGFPTANIELPTEKVRPAYGVYVSRARVGHQTWDSITNVGLRPTVDPDEKTPAVETYLYHTDQELYGKEITITLLEWIRPELVFDSMLQLGQKIQTDLTWAHQWHHQAEQCFERIRIHDIPVWFLYSSRFASASMHFVFRTPVEPRQLACHALLVNVLTATCERYPDRKQLGIALDRLYGASLDGSLQKQGNIQLLVFSLEALVHWQKQTSPFQEACDLLMDVLLKPDLTEKGQFRADIIESERQNLLLTLAARENDRTQQAYDASLKAYCNDQVHGLPAVGTIEALQTITQEELQQAYHRLLHEMELSIYLGGSIDTALFDSITEKLRQLPEAKRIKLFPGCQPMACRTDPAKQVTVAKSVEQARIVMVYDGLPPYYCQQGAVQSALLNSLLGGDVHSVLFRAVREERGLAYQIFSLQNRYLSALFILAGVSTESVDAAISEIQHQIHKIVTEPIDASLLQRSKELLRSGVESLYDDLTGLLAAQITAQATGRTFGRSEALSMIDSVTAEELKTLAAEIRHRMTFVMTSSKITDETETKEIKIL